MKRLQTIVATLIAGTLIGFGTANADSFNLWDLYRNKTTCSEINNVPVEYYRIRIDGNPFSSDGLLNDQAYFVTKRKFLVGQDLNEKNNFDKLILYIEKAIDTKAKELWDIEGVYYIRGTLKCMGKSKNDAEFYYDLSFMYDLLSLRVKGLTTDDLFYIDVDKLIKMEDY